MLKFKNRITGNQNRELTSVVRGCEAPSQFKPANFFPKSVSQRNFVLFG